MKKKYFHFEKKNIFPISLRGRLILLFVGAMSISMILFSVIMFTNVYNNTRDNLSQRIEMTVAAGSKSIDQSFLIAENLAMELAASEGVQKWLDDVDYYSQENLQYYNRKAEFVKELNRILIYSNAKKLNFVEYAGVFIDGDIVGYADIKSVGENKILLGLQKAYEQLETAGDKYIYEQLLTEPDNTVFHIRRLHSFSDTSEELVIMVATNERDIYNKYEDLNQNEGAIVYLVNEDNQVISTNRIKRIGTYLDEELSKALEEDKKRVKLNQSYLLDSEYLKDAGMRLISLYPQKLLTEQAVEAVFPYVVLSGILMIVSVFIAAFLGLRSTKFFDELTLAIRSVKDKNYDVKMQKYNDLQIDNLGDAFNEMVAEIKELIQNKYESQLLLNEMEIRFLQHQMNPHFLFNVLLTIQINAKQSKNETIYKMVSALASLLRASIYTDSAELITVRQELEYVEFYLYLQQMRFGDMISYEILVEDDKLKECTIPKLVIEPIVENAVIHGTENIDDMGRISIIVKQENNNLVAEVKDNGAGFDVEEFWRAMKEKREDGNSSREKIGLRNVDFRLKHIYGEKCGIEIESEINEGTQVRIIIPMEERE